MPSGAVAEMQGYVVTVGTTFGGPSRKSMIDSAARLLGLTFSRAQNYWYGEVRQVTADEADQIRERARAVRLERLERLKAQYEAERLALLAEAPEALAHQVPGALERGCDR